MKLYISAIIDFEVSARSGRTLRVARDAEGKALEKQLRLAARHHADECCRDMERILQQAEKQGKLFHDRREV